jgi:hypothetical protein
MASYSHQSEFPNEIKLGRTEKVPDYSADKEETPTKTKTYYPTLYISGVDGLGDLPKEGYALIYFRRKSLSITEGKDCGPIPCGPMDPDTSDRDKTTYSADLEIQELCLPDGESDDAGDAIDSMAEKAGLAIRGKKRQSDEEDDGDDYEEEE